MIFQPPYPLKTPNQNSANTPFILSFPQPHNQGVDVHQPMGFISENIGQRETPNPFMVRSGLHHFPIIEHHSPQPLRAMGSITMPSSPIPEYSDRIEDDLHRLFIIDNIFRHDFHRVVPHPICIQIGRAHV